MSIKDLTKLIAPPASPIESDPANQSKSAEDFLGLELPADYKAFGRTYGTGKFCKGFLQVFNPYSSAYEAIITSQLQILAGVVAAGMKLPGKPHPARPGLLPLGRDDNGHSLFWLTKGEANQWKIIARSHENHYETFNMPFTEFLARAFSNKIRPKIWGQPFTDNELVFEPAKPPEISGKKK